MKYKAIIETDDYKNFEFFEDGNGKYIHGIDAGAVNNEWIALYFTECEQEPVLDKIRAEIEQLTSRYSISKERGSMGQIEWSDRLIKESDVLQVIDKYKAESEDKTE